jgi:hypothetical protein
MPADGGAYASDEQTQDSHSESNMHAVGKEAAANAKMLRSTNLGNAITGGRPFGK